MSVVECMCVCVVVNVLLIQTVTGQGLKIRRSGGSVTSYLACYRCSAAIDRVGRGWRCVFPARARIVLTSMSGKKVNMDLKPVYFFFSRMLGRVTSTSRLQATSHHSCLTNQDDHTRRGKKRKKEKKKSFDLYTTWSCFLEQQTRRYLFKHPRFDTHTPNLSVNTATAVPRPERRSLQRWPPVKIPDPRHDDDDSSTSEKKWEYENE